MGGRLIGRLGFAPLLAILLAAGFGVRLAYVIGEGAGDPTYALPILDGAYYIEWATALAAGEAGAFAGHPGEAAGAFYLAPLYPLFLAGFVRIFGENYPLLFYVQQILSVASAGFLAVAGKRLISERAGLAAAVLFLAYHPLLFFASRPLGEALAIFLLTGALAVGAGRSAGSGFGSALLAGAATVARPNLLLVGVAWMLTGMAGRSWKRTVLFAAGLGITFVVLSTLGGRRRKDDPAVDLSAYECGLSPADPEHKRFTVKFYLIAMLFILFDLEVAFLYPWAVVYRDLGWYGFWLMSVFMGLLTVGFIYVWARGALDWSDGRSRRRTLADR